MIRAAQIYEKCWQKKTPLVVIDTNVLFDNRYRKLEVDEDGYESDSSIATVDARIDNHAECFMDSILERFDCGIWSSCDKHTVDVNVMKLRRTLERELPLRFTLSADDLEETGAHDLGKIWSNYREYKPYNTIFITESMAETEMHPDVFLLPSKLAKDASGFFHKTLRESRDTSNDEEEEMPTLLRILLALDTIHERWALDPETRDLRKQIEFVQKRR